MPVSTSTVPATIQPVNGSPRMTMPIRIVESGPIIPVCATTVAPTRSIAIITISTGAKVQRVAFSTESQITPARRPCRKRPQEEELGDAEEAGDAGRQAGEPHRAEALDLLAAGDEVDRIAHRAGEDEAGAERGVGALGRQLVAEHEAPPSS